MWTLVKWEDTTSVDEAWVTEEEASDLRPLTVVTVGKVLHQTNAYITIAGSVGCEDGEYGDVTCIPTGCILQIRNFEEPENAKT